jgi:2-oxoglutarate dehydrogenase E1 component
MILDRLMWSESFEKFMASKYPNEKRFGLEGCESLIPGMKALIDRSVEHGVKNVTIGMPHRGRLNVLANVIRKPIEAILNEFKGTPDPDGAHAGDVKYHLGANYVRPTPSGKKVALSLVANPSHLEAEDPVVLGKTRALQALENDEGEHKTALGVLLHGDAAFAGQGVVYETMGFHDLPNYGTGGTIHLIVNNQIGFTTDPRFARSTPYPSDLAKAIDAPIFHVNGDNVEAVNWVCQLAADYRAKWKRDVVIDVVCYRRYGHNETDQPSFTQPRMYKAIEKQPTALTQYTKYLIERGTFSEKDIEEHKKWVWDTLEQAANAAKDYVPTSKEWLSSSWQGFPTPRQLAEDVLASRPTGADEAALKTVGRAISTFPQGFQAHKNLARILAGRGKAVEQGSGIDWSTAEALAFGSLALEKVHIRVSGQDVERGTFSQRHAVIHDQENESQYIPLNNLGSGQARFVVCNSSLSEFGTLGFELGYSLVSPDSLTIWEAQFGDFANNAQCIIDQFIASGERKWTQRTGLVMSLPHGYDGQGPEHSSGRLERFLQLCDDHPHIYPSEKKLERQHQDCNMQVVYPTTPANYFHVLRRQIHRDFRKPLIVFFSKSLLRHPAVRSDLSEMTGETAFQRYLPEAHPEGMAAPEDIKRHILCSGQVYYELVKAREERGITNVAISRLEQVSPFPYDLLTPHLDKYPNADLLWCQEEPLNNGAWTYVGPRLQTAANETQHHKGKQTKYAGRDPTSSVATGSKAQHKMEVESFLNQAFDI